MGNEGGIHSGCTLASQMSAAAAAIKDDDCAQDAPSSVASAKTAAGQRCSSSARMQTGQVESRHMSSGRRCLSVRLVFALSMTCGVSVITVFSDDT